VPGAALEVDRPAEPAGPRSPVPGVTIAGLLIAVGLLALISQFSDWDPGPRGFLGAALLVVGLGLVAAAFSTGRTAKGGLVTLGIVLSLALLFASAEPWRGMRGGVGDRTVVPTTAEDVAARYSLGFGDTRLDFGRIDVSDLAEPIGTHVDAGVGDLDIVVPTDADVQIDVDAGLGSISLFEDGVSDGGLFPGRGAGSWVGDDDPELVITIDAGVGDVEVSRG
jgi:hypothetical protein